MHPLRWLKKGCIICYMRKPVNPLIKPNAKLVALWKAMKPAEREKLAKLARTTAGSMRHVVEGRREATPELAMYLESALEDLGLKRIGRGEISPTCGKCSYYRSCQVVRK